LSRRVLFVEVPGFYAAVEIAENPGLEGRPVVVGGDPRKRGLVQSASLEARRAGVEPEMTMVEALQICPNARALRTNMRRYREVSRRLLACLRGEGGRVEPFGLGGAYLESGSDEAAAALVERLRLRVRAELGLILRAGVASGKFLARLAAEEAGPDGVEHVPAGGEAAFLRPLPAGRLDGVGRKTAAALEELGARTIGDVAELGRERLQAAFGAHGLRIHALASAEDDAPVRAVRYPGSLSREVTIRGEDIDRAVLGEHLGGLALHLEQELRRQGLSAAQVALKVRYADEGSASRSQALAAPITAAAEIQTAASRLLDRTQAGSRPVRGLGIQLSKLAPAAEADRQLDLFPAR
jgi:DNA polymerase-4